MASIVVAEAAHSTDSTEESVTREEVPSIIEKFQANCENFVSDLLDMAAGTMKDQEQGEPYVSAVRRKQDVNILVPKLDLSKVVRRDEDRDYPPPSPLLLPIPNIES